METVEEVQQRIKEIEAETATLTPSDGRIVHEMTFCTKWIGMEKVKYGGYGPYWYIYRGRKKVYIGRALGVYKEKYEAQERRKELNKELKELKTKLSSASP